LAETITGFSFPQRRRPKTKRVDLPNNQKTKEPMSLTVKETLTRRETEGREVLVPNEWGTFYHAGNRKLVTIAQTAYERVDHIVGSDKRR
jgi:hypothetical protein